MVTAISVKNQIDSKIFNGMFKTTAVYASLLTPSLNIYGDNLRIGLSAYNLSGSSNLVIALANVFNTKETFYMFGNLEKGDQDILIQADQITPGIGDYIGFNYGDYRVKMVKEYHIGSTNVVTFCRITELI